MSYGLFLLLPTVAASSPQDVSARLREHFANLNFNKPPQLSNRHGEILVTFGEWEVRIVLDHGVHVVEEAQEIADDLRAGQLTAYEPDALERAKSADLASFAARLDIACDDDPEMDHFTDYLCVVEALRDIEGAIAFEHTTGNFM